MKNSKIPLRYKKIVPAPDHSQRLTKYRLKNWFFHPIFLSVFSACLIGLVFGWITLHFLIEDSFTEEVKNVQLTNEEVGDRTSPPTSSEQIEIQFYVLQAGMFEQKENATEMLEQLKEKNVSSLLWERDDRYYLLIDAFRTEDEARKRVQSLEQSQIDSFVKEWSVSLHYNVHTEEEAAWLDEFVTIWYHSLQQLENGIEISESTWNPLVQALQSAESTPLFAEKQQQLAEIFTTNDWNSKPELLKQLVQMEQLFS